MKTRWHRVWRLGPLALAFDHWNGDYTLSLGTQRHYFHVSAIHESWSDDHAERTMWKLSGGGYSTTWKRRKVRS